MKIRAYFLFVLFLLLGHTVNAHEYLLGLDKVNVDLSKQPVPINLVELIDARPQKENIGWVQRSILNKKVHANFENSFEIELSDFINKSTSNASEALPLIIKINSLVIWEKTLANSEYAYVKLDLDFYAKVKEEDYRHLYRSVAMMNSSGMEVTSHHDDNIAAAFQQCFNELTLLDVQALLVTTKSEPYEKVFSERSKEIVPEYPIFSAEPVKGVYQSFNEFINNAPSLQGQSINRKKGVWLTRYITVAVVKK
ncbi:hypothetical protein [Cesiribacter sp. SM1]|uniref:hypothetical protein n=1 Tax=Cesiribacter sp. SM1 TaxID=2861196 RepID=UPI001CD6D78B|nr:hypothetical protein [Cesiribacter sp. SM1]